MLAEACKPTEQARGMAILSLGWGMGSTLGPMLGGSLASPCDRWQGSFLCREGSLFAARCAFEAQVEIQSTGPGLAASCSIGCLSVLAIVPQGLVA